MSPVDDSAARRRANHLAIAEYARQDVDGGVTLVDKFP